MKSNLFHFFFFLSSFNVYAQVGFQERDFVDPSINAEAVESVYPADLDGDGDMDILSASRFDDQIAWYRNADGQGSFPEQIIISTNADEAISVHAADLDGDGDLDVLSASEGDNKIAWYENMDGLGTFGTQQIISTNAENAKSVYAADLDGDGDMDVLSASRIDDKVAWYKNTNGLGNFVEQTAISTIANQVQSVHAADIDGDGDMDVLSASPNDFTMAWYENMDGQGNFSTEQSLETLGDQPEFVYAADMDNDGDMDLISASPLNNRIAWYNNLDGAGNFSNRQSIASLLDAESAYAVDLDNDGDLDVVASGGSSVVYYENTDGLGDFGPAQVISNNIDLARFVYAANLDGDSHADVMVASTGQDKIAWYKNLDGLGDFSDEQLVTRSVRNVTGFDLVDVDGDNDYDLVVASPDNGRIAWYENVDGQGAYDLYHIAAEDLDFPRFAHTRDLDGDGDLDILSASAVENKIFWFENLDGIGTFGPEQIIASTLDFIQLITTEDFDGDGDLDILTSAINNEMAWYENLDGAGNFGTLQVITTELIAPSFLSVADIDNDGDQDILSLSTNENQIIWLENMDGLGSFSAPIIINDVLENPKFVYASDMDGDGDLDILASSSGFLNPSKIIWHENTDGLGSFGAENIITNVEQQRIEQMSFGDLDGDGDVDIFYSRLESFVEHMLWQENLDGAGNFGPAQDVMMDGASGGPLQAKDVDGDGDLDIVSGSESFAKLHWYENIGIVGNRLQGTVRLDLNANGCDDQDIIIENLLVKADNSINQFATFTGGNGLYQMAVTTGDFTSELVAPINYTANPTSYNDNFPDLGNIATNDFCLTPDQVFNDLSISLFPLDDARPGFDAAYEIVYKNIGTTLLSGNVAFEYDDTKLTFLTASSPIATQSNNLITFDFTALNPFETRTIRIDFNVLPPPTVNINEVLSFVATINPITGDDNGSDNIFFLQETVIGSYDPNDIRVLEGDKILLADTDKFLHYIIRFQNTGTAEAINVRVENILDPHLDWNSFQVEKTSHPNRVEILEGNEVSFIFDNILLPDSTNNEPESHGFIAYKIKPKSAILVGDIIYNEAAIFFDFNPPIETNRVMTEVIEPNSIKENASLVFSVYPIPTADVLRIKSETEISQLEIYDQLGRLVLSSIKNNQIDISSLQPGIYYCKVINAIGATGIEKVIVK